MNKLFWCGALAAALAGGATPAAAQDINLSITNGRVTLIAQDVTVRQILAEWARVGRTQILNGDKMLGAPITLELRDVPEAKALDIVLRSAAGYILAPRLDGQVADGSGFGRIVILATSQPPPVSSAPPAFNAGPRPMPQQFMVPPGANNADDTEPPNQDPNMVPVPGQPVPGQLNQPGVQPDPQMPQQPGQQPTGPITAPRPGPLPQQPTAPGGNAAPVSPFQPQPGVNRPPNRPGGGGGEEVR